MVNEISSKFSQLIFISSILIPLAQTKDAKTICIINLKEANLKNSFSDGRIDGAIKFKQFFDFNLNLDLNRTNFHILSRLLNNLEANTKKKLFVINKKINGKLNLTSEKVFSKNNFIDSFESQIKFENGNITSWSKDTHLTIKKIIKKKNFIIYDMRNIYSPSKMKNKNIKYFGIGR